MKNTQTLTTVRRKALNVLTAISLFALMLPATSSPALAQAETNEAHRDLDHSFEGSWICTVVQTSGFSFTALMSFAAGGVVVATGSQDKVNPISPVYGSWKQTGHNRIAVTIYFFLFDPIGNPVGTLKTNETFRLNGQNELAGSGSSVVCDVEGENCGGSGSEALITLTGKRIIPEGIKE